MAGPGKCLVAMGLVLSLSDSCGVANAFTAPSCFPPSKVHLSYARKSSRMYANTDANNRRSLSDILSELDAKGISYPPEATRTHLERLLRDAGANRDFISKRKSRQLHRDSNLEWNGESDIFGEPRERSHNTAGSKSRTRPSDEDYPFTDVEEKEWDEAISRRRNRRDRRRRQFEQSPYSTGSIFRVIDKTTQTVAGAVPEEIVDIGSKASRIVGRKTKQLFDDLVELTFEEEEEERQPKQRRSKRLEREIRKRRIQDLAERLNGVSAIDFESGNSVMTTKGPVGNPTTAGESFSTIYEEGMDPTDAKSDHRHAKPKIPIHKLVTQLNELNIPYSPDATREELERLLREAKDSQAKYAFARSSASAVDEESTGDAASRFWDNETAESASFKGSRTNLESTSAKVKAATKQVSSKVREKAKSTYRRASSKISNLFQDNDTSGETPKIIDAIVEDFIIDESLDVIGVEPLYREAWSTSQSRRKPSNEETEREHPTTVQTRRTPRQRTSQPPKQRRRRPNNSSYAEGKLQSVPSPTLPRLKPALEEDSSPRQRQASSRRRPQRPSTGRKIYSPYNRDDDMIVDGFGQFGDFVADRVESFLWGDEEDRRERSGSSSTRKQQTPGGPRTTRRGSHWKDRMEEQFDYLMGIHKDGESYSRWASQEGEDEQNVEGTDAVSYARGRAPRRGSKRRVSQRPIWEEQDSLLALLFGLDKGVENRNNIFYRSNSPYGSGSLVKILQTLLRSTTLVTGAVCRWASVRGSLPQPIVVVGVLSLLLCSRPGARMRNVALALVALRTIGELLHGYAYEDIDFWDPQDEDASIQERALGND